MSPDPAGWETERADLLRELAAVRQRLQEENDLVQVLLGRMDEAVRALSDRNFDSIGACAAEQYRPPGTEMEPQVSPLSPFEVLASEFHSGEACDCSPPSDNRPVVECEVWAQGILDGLHTAGYHVEPGPPLDPEFR